MQQPPLGLPGQLVYPFATLQDVMSPAQLAPIGQQPTFPSPVSVINMQVSSVGQQLFGWLMLAQLLVPLGHWNCRFAKRLRGKLRMLKPSGESEAWGRKGGSAGMSSELLPNCARCSSTRASMLHVGGASIGANVSPAVWASSFASQVSVVSSKIQ